MNIFITDCHKHITAHSMCNSTLKYYDIMCKNITKIESKIVTNLQTCLLEITRSTKAAYDD